MTQWGLDALFNPGKRHMDDEKRRLQSTREELGDSSGGRRIDLESGRVSISVGGRRARAADPDDDGPVGPVDAADVVLDAALEAEEVPAVALEADADITPEVVDDTAELTAPDPEPVAVVEEIADEPEADDVPIEAPTPVAVAPAPKKKGLSANAWSRRG